MRESAPRTIPIKGCGYYLASKGFDTRTIQDYLGHKQIQHTVKYTELAPGRFEGLWGI